MITKDQFFNEQTINIFTDASLKDHGVTVESVAGSLIVFPEINGRSTGYLANYTRLLGSTNNEGEIYAIYLGLKTLVDDVLDPTLMSYDVNLFSDSQISIFGLREWYKNWIDNAKKYNSGVLVSSSGKPVANQDIFIKIIDLIIRNNLKVKFYHVRGHMNPNVEQEYQMFLKDFMASNSIRQEPDRDLIFALAEFNDYVDYNSRALLLPEGASFDFPTITISNKYPDEHFEGVPVAPGFLFEKDMMSIATEKKRYAKLIGGDLK